ncbi:MAG: hypothetical protein LBQ47_02010, partial [Endomicrobium sp.]|nr:hypothetical protein [Endomicrobium sp.]
MNFYAKIKQQLRVFFLVLAKKLGNEKPKGPIFRNSKSIIEKEIKIPAVVSFAVTVSLVYAMFVLDVGFSYFSVFASLIFTAIIAFFFILQIKGREREILNDNDAVVLMCILTITGILVLQISKEYVSAFIFPAGAFVIMSAMLLSVRVGMLYAVMMSLYAGMLSDMRFDVFFVMFCGGMAAIVNIEKVRRRSDFIMSGLTITVVNALVITMFYMLKGYSGDYYGDNLLYCFLNGAASTVIILALMPLFEKLFSRITNIKLIELSDFNNPLLKRLML